MSHRRLKAASVCCVLCILAGAAVGLGASGRDGHTVPQGVHVSGMDWGGKTAPAINGELEAWSRRIGDRPIVLRVRVPASGAEKEWRTTSAALGLAVDVRGTVAAALAVGENDGLLQRLVALVRGRAAVDLPVRWHLDENRARRFLARSVAPSIERPPRDARFLANDDGSGQVVPEQPGVKLDADAAVAALRAVNPLDEPATVDLTVRTIQPRILAANLAGISGEVARFSTHYSETGNRARNIAVACRRINGTVLLPGDVFSYNQIVGPRESGSGFRLAPVIVRGKLEPGMGGGVCQVSTTLYNAALLADLQIVSRTHHAFPVHYVPAGRDATVAYGSIDFRFRNNTDGPIAVAASGAGGRVVMRIFGKPMPNRQVRLERTGVDSTEAPVRTTTDPRLPPGKRVVLEPGRSGHRAKLWRVVVVDGKRVKRELISSDTYAPVARQVAVGPRPPSPVAPVTQPALRQGLPASRSAPVGAPATTAPPGAVGGA